MPSEIYRKTLEAARAAAHIEMDPVLNAPPVGRLRDAYLAEYEREVARLRETTGSSDRNE